MNSNRLITYALNADNKMVHIDSVENGLACNCICPGCGEQLIAKNCGKIREHHFAHKSDKECNSGYMTMVHRLAEDIIEQIKVVPTPSGVIKAKKIAKEVRLEQFNIIPDIIALIPMIFNNQIECDIPIITEIYVTHKVNDEKLEIIKKAGLLAIEVDLSKIEFTTIEDLTNQIFNPINWTILNSKIGAQYLPKINVSIPYGLFNSFRNNPYSNNHMRKYKQNFNRRRRY